MKSVKVKIYYCVVRNMKCVLHIKINDDCIPLSYIKNHKFSAKMKKMYLCNFFLERW